MNASDKDLTRPNYVITIGSDTFDVDNQPSVLSVRVIRAMGLPTDYCKILLVESEDYSFNKDDPVKVELGYEDTLNLVFSGLVNEIDHEIRKARVTALGLGVRLLRLRLDRVYLNQTAGKIVSDIAQEAKLKVDTVADGINLPSYAIDDAKNSFQHVLKLAEYSNFDAYLTEEGELVFKEWGGGKSHPLYFGKEIIRIETFDFSPLYVGSKIYGESPSSTKGSGTSHWLKKKDVKSEVGSGAMFSVSDSAIRDDKTAETVAKARMTKLEYTFGVDVETVGKPEIQLGDSVTLEDLNAPAVKGQLEVVGIEHYVSKVKGFTTTINCRVRVKSR